MTTIILWTLLIADIALTIHTRLWLRGLTRHCDRQIRCINVVHDAFRHRLYRLENPKEQHP